MLFEMHNALIDCLNHLAYKRRSIVNKRKSVLNIQWPCEDNILAVTRMRPFKKKVLLAIWEGRLQRLQKAQTSELWCNTCSFIQLLAVSIPCRLSKLITATSFTVYCRTHLFDPIYCFQIPCQLLKIVKQFESCKQCEAKRAAEQPDISVWQGYIHIYTTKKPHLSDSCHYDDAITVSREAHECWYFHFFDRFA